MDPDTTRATADPRLGGVFHRVITHGPVDSLEEAARQRGMPAAAVIKTMVVRRNEDDYVFVLVPGDRVIDWAKLRSVLDERRLSMPDASKALEVTGYVRGTITPLGAKRPLSVVTDERVASGEVSIGGGARGVSITIDGNALAKILGADVNDVTKPQA
ncbi:MAG: YbaK/EbsC family protein [Actinobacteria bacterium]|nr:YbaK/EbsC family protein [Actinomycetota bacterium]